MTDLREAYFDRVFHPHFVVVHLAGFVFGLHLALVSGSTNASGLAIAHHAQHPHHAQAHQTRGATPNASAHAVGHEVGV